LLFLVTRYTEKPILIIRSSGPKNWTILKAYNLCIWWHSRACRISKRSALYQECKWYFECPHV